MIVWGGQSGTSTFRNGGRYDPVADTWTPTSTTGAPVSRANHTAVWTGSEMIVWGGDNGLVGLASGGRYDPDTNTWAPMDLAGAPSGRRFHTAVWSGDEMIVFGGCEALSCPVQGNPTQTGGRYDPVTDEWAPTSLAGAPSGRSSRVR